MPTPDLAVLYEHPHWFKPLFAELDRRHVDYDKVHIGDHSFDPCARPPYSLVVNRVSAFPSSSSAPGIVLYAKQYLAFLERSGVRVINGRQSYEVGASKALQMQLFKTMGLRTPTSRVIYSPAQAVDAAGDLRYPVLVKPNVGGSGSGIALFRTSDELARAVAAGAIDMGIDGVLLVQEYLEAKDNCIYRVEVLNNDLLYGIRLPIVGHSFNYCPADGCNIDRFDYCPVEGASEPAAAGVRAFQPTAWIAEKVKAVIAESGADLGGVEYLVNTADNQPYFYDINPLSNFVADAVQVVGFDPVPRFVDFILKSC